MELQQYTDELIAHLKQKLTLEEVQSEIHYDIPLLIVAKNKIHEILSFLKTDETYGFSFLTTMCGIHYPENDKNQEFAMMYQLHNMAKNTRVRFKIFMSKEEMEVPTVTNLWLTANWMEREAYDFYGFIFKGHPNMTRILNMDEMNYHPMRKEYAVEDGSRTDKEDKYFGR
jgi:NADH-quinone oxidoreductase subunit C